MRIPGVPYVQGRNSYGTSTKHGIAIHNTSNDATAEGEASYATRRTDGTSSHLYTDRDSVVQSLDTTARAGHAGSRTGNDHAVAVEITGVNGWSRQQWLERVAWDKLGAALAHVVRRYGIEVRRASVDEMRRNPAVRAFYGHDDMRRAWGGTTHTDPGLNFPWDRLFAAVNAALGTPTTGEDDDMTPAQFAALLDDPQVATRLRRLPWQYQDAGQPSAHGIVLKQLPEAMRALTAGQQAILTATGVDDAEVARIVAAMPKPPSADEIADAVLAGLGGKDLAEAAEALRAALGDGRAAELGRLLAGT